jgi:amino acid transporter
LRPLTREMKIFGALLLTLSAVTPASSVFVIVPGVIQQAGTGAFIGMAAAAVIGLCMACVYAELGSAFPLSGGEYAVFGRTLGAPVGFVYMGMNVVLLTLAPAVLSLGAGAYLAGVWPDAPTVPIAVGIVALATALGVLNIRTNAMVTGVFLAVEVAALVVLTGLGFAHPHRSVGSLISHPVALTAGHLAPSPAAMIGLATAVAIFAYNGFGSTVYFGEEVHGAPRRVARTILIAFGVTVACEFIPVIAVLTGAPDLKALIAAKDPFSDFVTATGGRSLNVAISLGVALAIVNAVIATVLINARFYYSSGRDRMWAPFFNVALTGVHGRFHSPWIATLLAGATAAAACFIPFHFLLVLNGAGVVVMYFLLCLAVVAGRRSGSTNHGAYRMPLYPLPPIVGLAALAYVLYANWIDLDLGRPSLIATAVLMALASLYYLVMRRRRGPGWAMNGPGAEDAAA